MSVTNKRRRKEDCTEDGKKPKKSSSASSQAILGNGDTEIFSTLIPLMEDLDVLKTCRLVCKSWNKFACLAMRKLPWVYYPVDEYYPWNLDNRLKLLEENKTLRLPSPFGNIQVCAGTFREQAFLRFLKYVRENTNSFSVELHINPHRSDVDPVELQTVLTSNQHNFKITQLFIYCDTLVGHIFQPENIRLPYLKLLAIGNDNHISANVLDMCGNLCQFSPLKSLQVGGTTRGENLRKLMPPGGMKPVENLSLQFVSINSEDCKYVCERVMEIPCLRKLGLYLRRLDAYHCRNYPGFEAIIEHFAESLESLTGDCLPFIKNRCFPKLREINFKDFRHFCNEFSFPVERYPLLKRVTFVVKKLQALKCPYFEKESLGVEELSIKFLEDPVFHDEILKFISVAGMVFSNVSSFCIFQSAEMSFASEMLVAICKSFPKLTAFELRADVGHCRPLIGLPLTAKTMWLGKGWTLEKIPREASLLDFPGLEKLSFGPDVSVSEDLFMLCLSKMPRLQYLTFYLTQMVPAKKIRDSVGHLKRITILFESSDVLEDWVEEMERLQKMLPSVVEIKKITSESSLGFRGIQRL